MKLWTWQNPVFDITDPSTPVDSQSYSIYEHKEEYRKLWKIYGTDQFLWCYSSFEDATNHGALEYKDKILWKLEVPESSFLGATCGHAWHWIISDMTACPPDQFEPLFGMIQSAAIKKGVQYRRDDFSRDFNLPWKTQCKEDLYGMLSVDLATCKIGCPIIILKHPIEQEWFVSKQLHEDIDK